MLTGLVLKLISWSLTYNPSDISFLCAKVKEALTGLFDFFNLWYNIVAMVKDKKYYDDFFRKFGAKVHDDPVRFLKIASLCKGDVLDLGCGTGCLADFYDGKYVGVDISDVAIKFAKETRRATATFEIANPVLEQLPIYYKFDTVVMSEFLEHIDREGILFANIKSRLKPDGRIIISVPNGNRIPDESHVREFTVPQLRKHFSKLGKVKFYNYPGFQERILMSVDLGQKNDNLISLVMPTKNEEVGLENAILSCIDFVDNIVVSVDDSSTDKTLEVAKRYADQVKVYQWENSFCKARNFAQYGITTKWILALDGHEFVESYPDLEKHLSENVDGLEIRILLENGFKFHFPRIIRSFVKWEADVHNYPLIKSRKLYTDFIICHDRENLQARDSVKIRDKQRSEMVIGIMTKELRKNKKAVRPLFYLAQQYFSQKDFKKAIKFYSGYLKYSKHKGERWLAWYEKAGARMFLNQKLRVLWDLDKADKEIPGRWEVEKLRGSVWAMIGNHERAVKHYVQSFSEQTGNFTYLPVQRDDAHTWDFIGHSLFALKKTSEAKVAWNRSLELEKAKPKENQNEQRLKILERMLKY